MLMCYNHMDNSIEINHSVIYRNTYSRIRMESKWTNGPKSECLAIYKSVWLPHIVEKSCYYYIDKLQVS